MPKKFNLIQEVKDLKMKALTESEAAEYGIISYQAMCQELFLEAEKDIRNRNPDYSVMQIEGALSAVKESIIIELLECICQTNFKLRSL